MFCAGTIMAAQTYEYKTDLNTHALEGLIASDAMVLCKRIFNSGRTSYYCSDGSHVLKMRSGGFVILPKASQEMLSNNRILLTYWDGLKIVILPSGAIAFHNSEVNGFTLQ